MTAAAFNAITAAGMVYNAADFSDPHLDGPTALTVTADGRVFGHLAKWGTCHIGYGNQCVQPPTSAEGYRYFHQGVVPTDKGDLPVGKITLGTGHAPVDGRTDAVAAAAHYDNTGSVVAVVRAGEDQHGIWLAGRMVPGVEDSKVDELRRSGVSGDWRGVNGHHELVAALAVNVPGFPVPRTEQLVASGGVSALVAAGIVLRPEDMMPKTPEELAEIVAAAVDKELGARDAASKRAGLAAKIAGAVQDSAGSRRSKAAARMAALRKSSASDKVLTAAGGLSAQVDDATGHMPHQLKAYWTRGAGLARWAPKPHPWTALVHALEKEVPGKSPGWYHGLASNLFHDVFGIWPGERKGKNPVGPASAAMVAAAAPKALAARAATEGLAAAGDGASGDHDSDGMIALLPSAEDASRLAVDGGEPADELHVTLAYFPDADDMDDPADIADRLQQMFPGGVQGDVNGHAVFNPDHPDKTPCAVYLMQAPGLADAHTELAPDGGDYDSYVPHMTAQYDPTGPLSETGSVTFDRARIAKRGHQIDVPLADSSVTAAAPAVPQAPTAPAGDGRRRVRTEEGARRYGVSVGELIQQDVNNVRDRAGEYAEAAGRDVAQLITGRPAPAPAVPSAPAAPAPAPAPAVRSSDVGDDGAVRGRSYRLPNQKKTSAVSKRRAAAGKVGQVYKDAPPARKSGSGDYMEEDEVPDTGALGGKLIDYDNGVATYSDGSQTDGKRWKKVGAAGAKKAKARHDETAAQAASKASKASSSSGPSKAGSKGGIAASAVARIFSGGGRPKG